MSANKRPIAFVIMPFAASFDRVFSEIIQPALIDFDVIRADSRLDERNILARIVTGIDEADLVVADVTHTNANVMYELGVSHALGKPTMMIAENVSRLPFDICSYPVHEYGTEQARADKLSALLSETAIRHREGVLSFGNPVADFIPRIGAVLATSQPATEYTADMCVADVTWAADMTGRFFERFHASLNELDRSLSSARSKVTNVRTTPAMDNPGVYNAAAATRRFANDFDELSITFHEIWERYGRALRWLLAPEQFPYVGVTGVQHYVAGARKTQVTLDGALGDLAELRGTLEHFSSYSGNLTHALDLARTSISNLLNEIMTAKGYLAWVIRHDLESA